MATTKKKIFSKITGKEIFLPNSPKPKSEVGVTKLKTEPIAETITKPFTGSPIINKPVGDAMPPLSAEGLENEQIALAEAEKQKARDLFAGNEFTANQEIADEFGLGLSKSGEKLFASTLEEEIARRKKAQDESTSFLTEQQQLQREQEQAQLRQLQTSGESQAASVAASLTPGREGFVGGTAKEGISQFKQLIAEKIDLAGGRLRMAENSRAQQMKELKAAQDAGDKQLVQSIRQGIAVAEQEITKNKAALIDAQVQANEQALKIAQFESAESRANFDSFQTLVETGIDLDANALIGLSTRMNIPADIVNGVYQGMDFIRKDKSLSLAEKQVGYEQELNKLRDYQLGLSSKEAKKVDDFLNLSRSGNYSQEQLQSFAIAMDIPNDKNPVFLADLKIKQAEAKIKDAESRGELVDPRDRLDLAEQTWKYRELTGQNGLYKPTSSKYPVAAQGNGIRVEVTDGQKLGYVNGRDTGQCGAFVNDVLGIGVGDKLSDKTKFIDYSIAVPQPGMAFVQGGGYDLKVGESGHIGIVESVNPDGTFNTVEANLNNDRKVSRRNNVAVNEVIGFIRPNKSEFVGGAGGSSETVMAAQSLLLDFGGTEGEREQAIKNIVSLVNSGGAKNVAEAKIKLNLISKSDKDLQKAMDDETKTSRDNFNDLNNKLLSLPALVSSGTGIGDVGVIVNFLKVLDPRSVARESEVQSIEQATSLVGQMEQAFNKALSGEKLTSGQRKEIIAASKILQSSAADYYLSQLYSRTEDLKAQGIPVTFVSNSQVKELERIVGAERVAEIKGELGVEGGKKKVDTNSLWNDIESGKITGEATDDELSAFADL